MRMRFAKLIGHTGNTLCLPTMRLAGYAGSCYQCLQRLSGATTAFPNIPINPFKSSLEVLRIQRVIYRMKTIS